MDTSLWRYLTVVPFLGHGFRGIAQERNPEPVPDDIQRVTFINHDSLGFDPHASKTGSVANKSLSVLVQCGGFGTKPVGIHDWANPADTQTDLIARFPKEVIMNGASYQMNVQLKTPD